MKENEFVENKKSTAELKEGIISIVAILNKHNQGELYFGVKNDGSVVGQNVSESTLRQISQTISTSIEPRIYPVVTSQELENKTYIKISFEGNEQPYFANGRAYIRVADEDKQLSAKELENFFIKKNFDKLAWDSAICKDAGLDAIDETKLKAYLKLSGKEFDSVQNALDKLGVTKGSKLTNSAVLLFGKTPSEFLDNAYLRCALFATNNTSSLLDMQDYSDDVLTLIERAQNYILRNIRNGIKIEGLHSVYIPEISKDAFREAIINAFCHRDYKNADPVHVAIFKDHIEIRSPGLLFGNLTINDILTKQVSVRRNPIIAKLFKDAHLIESWGVGVKKMLTLEPTLRLEEVGIQFYTIFKRDSISELSSENGSVKSSDRILELIKQNPKISAFGISKILKITSRAVEKQLSALKKGKLLIRVGPPKGGHWEVLK